jgi:hypothetical protein
MHILRMDREYIARPECITAASVHGLTSWAAKEYTTINVRPTDAIYLHMRRHGHGGARGYTTQTTAKSVRLTSELSTHVVNAINRQWTAAYAQVE